NNSNDGNNSNTGNDPVLLSTYKFYVIEDGYPNPSLPHKIVIDYNTPFEKETYILAAYTENQEELAQDCNHTSYGGFIYGLTEGYHSVYQEVNGEVVYTGGVIDVRYSSTQTCGRVNL
ncbi:MAG: hypothetical protein KDD05_03655, partial [Psychroserpens sp.]|nr:hypothetical protein [Psychroserpens sp.]